MIQFDMIDNESEVVTEWWHEKGPWWVTYTRHNTVQTRALFYHSGYIGFWILNQRLLYGSDRWQLRSDGLDRVHIPCEMYDEL